MHINHDDLYTSNYLLECTSFNNIIRYYLHIYKVYLQILRRTHKVITWDILYLLNYILGQWYKSICLLPYTISNKILAMKCMWLLIYACNLLMRQREKLEPHEETIFKNKVIEWIMKSYEKKGWGPCHICQCLKWVGETNQVANQTNEQGMLLNVMSLMGGE